MKILHVLPSLKGYCGGPVQVVTQLCQELRLQGVDAAIATTDRDSCAKLDVPLYSFPSQFSAFFPPRFSVATSFRGWFAQHAGQFHLLHIHYLFTYPSTIACYYARKYGIPYIIRPAGMLSRYSLSKSALKKRSYMFLFENKNLRRAAAVHFTSEEEMKEAGALGLDMQGMVLPPGLNPENFKSLESLESSFKRRYPQAKDKKIILFLARLDPKKGLDILLPALKILTTRRKDFIFVLAGSGPKTYERWVKRALAVSGLSDLTILTGFVDGDTKLGILSDSDVFVLPSYDENFGIAVVEAMACGLPVVVSNRVHIHHLIESYQAGLITGLDSQEVASRLDKLLSDDSLRFKMGSCARRLVKDKFDITEIARKMQEIYSRLIRAKGVGRVF